MPHDPSPPAGRPRLLIIVGSTRPSRLGLSVARWLERIATGHGAFEIDFADLQALALPMMDEPNHPRLQNYLHEHTKAWSARVAAADAVVMVTPEYNAAYSAPLKNAIDYLCREWLRKPLGIVSYGGVSAGTRAAAALRQVVAVLGMVPTVANVAISMVREHLAADGSFVPPAATDKTAGAMLDELVRLDETLRPLRAGAAQPRPQMASSSS